MVPRYNMMNETFANNFERYEFRSIDALSQVAYNRFMKTWHPAHVMDASEENRWICIQMLKANERLRHETGHLQVESFFESEGKYYVVYEPLEKGAVNLLDLMKAKKGERLPEKFVKTVARLLLKYLESIHNLNIIHRDLKIPNIYIYKSGDGGDWGIKVKDLRYCTIDADSSILSSHRGSPAYLAPEVTYPNPYCAIKAETYSVGVILYVLATGNYPFLANNPQDLIHTIRTAEVCYPCHVSPFLRSFLQLMLHKDPFERLSLKSFLEHPWIQSASSPQVQKEEDTVTFVPTSVNRKIFNYAETAY